ncbi:hypothetical protein HPB49_017265 [Dermacentor silvarum]|uniref:Uncharacterized protein n=1 Tax=Dermacentor silvarum TaxID=543639 RepID=A0ACB8E221_DERSI|nr:hypothetical protein HPB49_017265 [Dermacentor silvarum]
MRNLPQRSISGLPFCLSLNNSLLPFVPSPEVIMVGARGVVPLVGLAICRELFTRARKPTVACKRSRNETGNCAISRDRPKSVAPRLRRVQRPQDGVSVAKESTAVRAAPFVFERRSLFVLPVWPPVSTCRASSARQHGSELSRVSFVAAASRSGSAYRRQAATTLPQRSVFESDRRQEDRAVCVSSLHIGPRVHAYVTAFLAHRTTEISYGPLSSPSFSLGNKGTPQSSVLSPLLFNVTLFPLACALLTIPALSHPFYADDITLWVTTGNLGDMETTLQAGVDALRSGQIGAFAPSASGDGPPVAFSIHSQSPLTENPFPSSLLSASSDSFINAPVDYRARWQRNRIN